MQRLHATQAAADDGGEALDAEVVCEQRLAAHPVLHADDGEIRAVDVVAVRPPRAGTGTAMAATKIVQRNDEPLVGVDCLPRSDAVVPPTGFLIGQRVYAGCVMVTRKGVADQNGIRSIGVQRAIGFIDQVEARQFGAAAQAEGGIVTEYARRDDAQIAAGEGRFTHMNSPRNRVNRSGMIISSMTSTTMAISGDRSSPPIGGRMRLAGARTGSVI